MIRLCLVLNRTTPSPTPWKQGRPMGSLGAAVSRGAAVEAEDAKIPGARGGGGLLVMVILCAAGVARA